MKRVKEMSKERRRVLRNFVIISQRKFNVKETQI